MRKLQRRVECGVPVVYATLKEAEALVALGYREGPMVWIVDGPSNGFPNN